MMRLTVQRFHPAPGFQPRRRRPLQQDLAPSIHPQRNRSRSPFIQLSVLMDEWPPIWAFIEPPDLSPCGIYDCTFLWTQPDKFYCCCGQGRPEIPGYLLYWLKADIPTEVPLPKERPARKGNKKVNVANNLFVSYDLYPPSQDYEKVADTIKILGAQAVACFDIH